MEGQGKIKSEAESMPNASAPPASPRIAPLHVSPAAMRCPQTLRRDRYSPGKPLAAASAMATRIRARGI